MDNETKKFLSQNIYFNCPRCEKNRHYTLKDLGKQVVCAHCGHIVEFNKELNIDSDIDEDLIKSIKEYLKEIKGSSCK